MVLGVFLHTLQVVFLPCSPPVHTPVMSDSWWLRMHISVNCEHWSCSLVLIYDALTSAIYYFPLGGCTFLITLGEITHYPVTVHQTSSGSVIGRDMPILLYLRRCLRGQEGNPAAPRKPIQKYMGLGGRGSKTTDSKSGQAALSNQVVASLKKLTCYA